MNFVSLCFEVNLYVLLLTLADLNCFKIGSQFYSPGWPEIYSLRLASNSWLCCCYSLPDAGGIADVSYHSQLYSPERFRIFCLPGVLLLHCSGCKHILLASQGFTGPFVSNLASLFIGTYRNISSCSK